MNRRNDRRQRILDAFEAFHDAVAAARGAAKRAHDVAALQQARETFEQDLRARGIDQALRDPDYAQSLTDPRLARIVAQAKDDWEQAFAKWTNNGPRALTDLVAEAAPGSASEDYENWLGQIGTVDGRGPVPGLWRIGSAIATSSPVPLPFPVAVPLLDRSHLAVFTSTRNRPVAE
ncbi:MAG: cell division protein FtsK, partial [Jatrophihabitantaceae bacterium]